MKHILTILFIVIIFQSCKTNTDKEKLIGNWSIPNGLVELEFYKDSLIVTESGYYKYINEWSIDKSKLYLETVKGLDSFGLKTKLFDYKLSVNLDTLFLKQPSDSIFKPPFLRIKSAFDYLTKQQYLTIDLPSKQHLIKEPESSIGLNIYAGYNNGKLIAKSDDESNLDLTDINFFAYEYMAVTKEGIQDNLHYNLIADKNIPVKELDSIREILKSTDFNDIFRVYTNEVIDYNKTGWREKLVWYGSME